MDITIPTSEIKQPSFHADELGFVFVWNGHLLRGIYPNAVPQARSYFDSGFIDEVVQKRLFPKTWISNFRSEQFGIILEHEFIQPTIYATEWNFQMLKDAALMVLAIAQIGRKYGYDMIDCHKLNVMFLNNSPLYVDLGSFVPAEKGAKGWHPYSSFLRSYYYILDIWRNGAPLVAKRMMSPHVEMEISNYYSLKSAFYRNHRKVLHVFCTINSVLCKIANMGDNRIEKNSNRKLLFCVKGIVNRLKLAPNLRLSNIERKIRRMKLPNESVSIMKNSYHKEAIIDVLNKRFSDSTKVTFINNGDYEMYDEIIKKTSIDIIYSIQENDIISNDEYLFFHNTSNGPVSLNYLLTGGEILLRNKFPEDRFSSDLVVWPGVIVSENYFAVHNVKVKLRVLMKYTNLNTVIMTINNSADAIINGLSVEYQVQTYEASTASSLMGGGSCLIINALQ